MSYIVEESNNFLSRLPARMREEYDTVLSQFKGTKHESDCNDFSVLRTKSR